MMRTFLYSCLVVLVASMVACTPRSTPRVYQNLDTVLTSGRVETYGAFYAPEGIDLPVFCLDLYGQGIGLNDEGVIEGKGTNLYLSDIFVPVGQTELPEGTYTSDSVAREMTFLRGMNYGGNYAGSYVLLVGESSYSVYPIRSAAMLLSYAGDTMVIDGSALLENKKTYPFHFRAVTSTVDRERKTQMMHKLNRAR